MKSSLLKRVEKLAKASEAKDKEVTWQVDFVAPDSKVVNTMTVNNSATKGEKTYEDQTGKSAQ